MNKKNLVDIVANETSLKKSDIDAVITVALNAIRNAVKEGDKVQLKDFGTFKLKERKERVGRNPRTKEEITIAASKSPAFVPAKAFKDDVQ